MPTITNCNTTAAATFAIAMNERRAESAAFIVSSFSTSQHKANNDGPFQHRNSRNLENRKSRFAIMLSRSIKTGLFENVERHMHAFKRDDIVTVFQMSPAKGLFIEGKAVIRNRVADVDEQYQVTFINEPGEIYERFVDRQGQANPTKYVEDFNKRIGKAA